MNQIVAILNEIRPESDFVSSKDFIDDGLLDSFDVVSLVSALDKTYRISIPGTDIVPDNFRNIDSITALLQKSGVSL